MAPEAVEKICNGTPEEGNICNGEKEKEKINSEEPDELKKVKLHEAQLGKSESKVELNADEHEALSRHVPKYIRTRFATKIWSLLSIQMFVTFVISIIVEAFMPDFTDFKKKFFFWVGSSFIAFVFMSLLRKYQKKFPLNYICLSLAIIATGFFWGMTKYIVQNFFNHNLCGIVMGSLLLSAACFLCGITGRLAAWFEPKYSREKQKERRRAKSLVEQNLGDIVWEEEKEKQGAEGVLQQIANIKDDEIEQLRKANDGVMRATMLIGLFTWLIASAACYLITFIMITLSKDEDWMFQEHWRKNAKYSSAIMAAFFAFPMLLFFHFDVDRQMRKCRQDQAMRAIVNINSDIAICFIIMYALCAIMACNQSSIDMRADDIGGGDGGMDMDVGGGGLPDGDGVPDVDGMPDADGTVGADTTL